MGGLGLSNLQERSERCRGEHPCLPLNSKDPEERGLWADPGPLPEAAMPPAKTVGVRELSAPARRQAAPRESRGQFSGNRPSEEELFYLQPILPVTNLRKSQEHGMSWPRVTKLQSAGWGTPIQVGLRPSPQTRVLSAHTGPAPCPTQTHAQKQTQKSTTRPFALETLISGC